MGKNEIELVEMFKQFDGKYGARPTCVISENMDLESILDSSPGSSVIFGKILGKPPLRKPTGKSVDQ